MSDRRFTVSPMRIRLESHENIFEWQGPWDSSFEEVLDVFVGLCSAATYGDKTELYKLIYSRLQDEYEAKKQLENMQEDV